MVSLVRSVVQQVTAVICMRDMKSEASEYKFFTVISAVADRFLNLRKRERELSDGLIYMPAFQPRTRARISLALDAFSPGLDSKEFPLVWRGNVYITGGRRARHNLLFPTNDRAIRARRDALLSCPGILRYLGPPFLDVHWCESPSTASLTRANVTTGRAIDRAA